MTVAMTPAFSLARRIALSVLVAAFANSTLASPATAQSLCSSRNGSGVNPNGFACVNDPVIGTNWNTTVDIVTPAAAASAVRVFGGGPLSGVPFGFGELLCAPPFLVTDFSAGSHSIPIPNLAALVGLTFCTQAVTISSAPVQFQLQNAIDITIGAVGNQDITVLVLIDDGNNSSPPTPVNGAVVTLQGTNAASYTGLTMTTGASGTATFFGVAGPYSVTAQADSTAFGTTTRVASSLVDVVPAVSGAPLSGTIGVLLFADFESSPAPDAFLSGTVANLPPLSGNEFVEVVAVANGPVDFEGSAFVDPITGSYSMPIPSSTLIDCFVAHRADPAFNKRAILASLLQPGVGQTAPGTTLTRNFDFGSQAVVPWDVPVSFTATNVHPAAVLSIQLLVEDAVNGVDYDFSFFDGNPGPSSITLPDVTDPNFDGYQIELDADTFDPFGVLEVGQDCSNVLTTTPASVTFDFFSLPSILQPPNLATGTLAQLNNLTVQVAEGSTGAFGNNGLNVFFVSTETGLSGPPPPGIDQSSWTVFTPAGVTSFDLPPYSLPMFGATQTLFCGMEQIRFAGYPFDYDAFFSGSLAANFTALETTSTGSCSSEIGITVFLTP